MRNLFSKPRQQWNVWRRQNRAVNDRYRLISNNSNSARGIGINALNKTKQKQNQAQTKQSLSMCQICARVVIIVVIALAMTALVFELALFTMSIITGSPVTFWKRYISESVRVPSKYKNSEMNEDEYRCWRFGTRDTAIYAQYGGALARSMHVHWLKSDGTQPLSKAYGCSMHTYYCNGAPKPIPCCTHILFEFWHLLDKYLTLHNVSYTLRYGSLLFAIRDRRHNPWDTDLDLGFLRPAKNAEHAIAQLIAENPGIVQDKFGHHLFDINGVLYTRYHAQYGYPERPSSSSLSGSLSSFCFHSLTCELFSKPQHSQIWNNEFPNVLILGGSSQFIDYSVQLPTADAQLSGMNVSLSIPTEHMIEVELDGVHGMKAPRKMYTFPEWYKHLAWVYGPSEKYMSGYASFLNNKEYLTFFGLDDDDNHDNDNDNDNAPDRLTMYRDRIFNKTTELSGNQNWENYVAPKRFPDSVNT